MDKKFCTEGMNRASEALRKLGVKKEDFNEGLKNFYLNGGKNLNEYLKGKYKLNNELSLSLTKTIEARLSKRLEIERKNRSKTFKDILDKSEAGKILKPQIIDRIARKLSDPKTGVLSYAGLQQAIAKELGQKLYSKQSTEKLQTLSKKYQKLEKEIRSLPADTKTLFSKKGDLILEQEFINAEIEDTISSIEKPSLNQYLEDIRYNTNLLADANTISTNIRGGFFSLNPVTTLKLARDVVGGDKEIQTIVSKTWGRSKKLASFMWRTGLYIDPVKTGRLNVEGKNQVTVPLPLLREVSKMTKIAMGIPDYFIYGVVHDSTLAREMKISKVKAPTLEMLEIAEQEALLAVARDKDVFMGTNGAEALHKVVSSIDAIGDKLPDITIGNKKISIKPKIGNKILPFTNIVGNLMGRQLTGGSIRGIWELAQMPFNYKNLSPAQRRQRWRRVEEGIGDAAFLTAIGIAYNTGGIIAPMALNYEEDKAMQAAGMKEGTVKVGDKYFDFLQVATPLDFKAKAIMRVSEALKRIRDVGEYITDPKQKDQKSKEIWSETFLRLSQDPILTQLSRNVQEAGFNYKNQSSQGFAEELFYKSVDALVQQVGQYIPLNRQLKNLGNIVNNGVFQSFDVIETYDSNPLARTWNKFIGGYGVGDTRAGITGKDLERLYTLNVIQVSKDRQDKVAKEVIKVQRESSEAIIDPMPRTVDKQKLTGEQWKKGNILLGKSRAYFINELMDRAEYEGLNPIDKAFVLDQTEKASVGLALLGSIGKPLPKASVAGRLARIVQSDLPKAAKSTAISAVLMRQLQKSKRPKADKTKRYEIEEINIEED